MSGVSTKRSKLARMTNLGLEGESTSRVGDLDAKSLGSLENSKSLSRRNVVGNLGGEDLGVHEQELNLVSVGDEESLVAGGHHVLGGLVGTVTNLGHSDGASESSSDTRVNTLGLSPGLTNSVEPVGLMSLESLLVLLDNLGMGVRGGHLELV